MIGWLTYRFRKYLDELDARCNDEYWFLGKQHIRAHYDDSDDAKPSFSHLDELDPGYPDELDARMK